MIVEVNWNGRNVVTSYKLKGKTPKAILKELNAREEWGKFNGRVKAQFASDSKNVFTVKLSPESKISMPSWPAYKSQPSKVQQNWNEVYRDLKKHEDGHAEIFEKGVDTLKKKFEGMSETTQKQFTEILNEFDASNEREHKAYDSKTNHGRDSGTQLITSE